MKPPVSGVQPASDPQWFRRSIFYELSVRGFYDASGDGNGDLRGLIDKLDYLQWLGVDCIWLLPFYASPLRDGGYDISDFYAVHPDFGTADDAEALIEAKRNLRAEILAEHVAKVVAEMPPLTDEQCERIAGLLLAAGGE